jgi:hypothetical protein
MSQLDGIFSPKYKEKVGLASSEQIKELEKVFLVLMDVVHNLSFKIESAGHQDQSPFGRLASRVSLIVKEVASLSQRHEDGLSLKYTEVLDAIAEARQLIFEIDPENEVLITKL